MTETQSDQLLPIHPPFGRCVLGFWKPTAFWRRLALTIAWLICLIVVRYAIAMFSVPPLPHFDGSLLCSASPLTAIVVVAVLLIICTLLGTIIAGGVCFEAGFFAATLAMAGLSLRGGTMQSVLFDANGRQSVFYTLAGETLLLAAILVGIWLMLMLISRRISPPAPLLPPTELNGYRLGTLLVQIAATAVIIELLALSEAKNQVLGAIFLGSLIGAMAAYFSFPSRSAFWHWLGPLLVGTIGYLLAARNAVTGTATGNLEGLLAPLARPLPLDYASVGPAGAIIGWWIAQHWGKE